MKKYKDIYRLPTLLLNLTVDKFTFETYWCRVYQNPQPFIKSQHNHSFFEIHYCLDGDGILDVCGVPYILRPNMFIITPPYCHHTCVRQSDDFKKFVWGVRISATDKDAMASIDELCALSIKIGAVAASKVMENCIDTIECCLGNTSGNHIDVIKATLATIFYEMEALVLDTAKITKDSIQLKLKNDDLVQQAITYMSDNLSMRCSVTEIAEEFMLSKRHFTRIFQSCTGISPANYYKKLRFIKAEKLLLDTNMTLEEISANVGYSDGFTFSKAFKAYSGASPKEFRESIKDK